MDFQVIESKLKYTFKNKALIEQAFTHSSYGNEKHMPHNERMEFLGDSILGYVVTEYLFENFPDKKEGELSTMKSNIVSANGLRPVMEKLGLTEHLCIVDDKVTVDDSKKIPANLFEAILAAIYLDGGLLCAKEFVLNQLAEQLQNANSKKFKDDKSLLNEHFPQPKFNVKYEVVEKSGPDHNPTYKCAVIINGKQVAVGTGTNIKAAEQQAAHKIVKEWRID